MPESSGREYRTSVEGDRATVWAAGDIDLVESANFERLLLDLADKGARHILVDMTEVTFVGSSGLNALVVARNRLAAFDGDISLRSPSKIVRRILELTTLDQVLSIVD